MHSAHSTTTTSLLSNSNPEPDFSLELSISVDYRPDWGVWEGLREFVQNTIDGKTQFGGTTHYDYKEDNHELFLTNHHNTTLKRNTLLLGVTSKKNNSGEPASQNEPASQGEPELIGQFGDGMKIGTLALLRAGKEVHILSGTELWKARIRESKHMSSQVLSFDIYTDVPPFQGVKVRVGGVYPDEWRRAQDNFLHFTDQETVSVLTEPERKGKFYVKGIFVQENPKFFYGYNFLHEDKIKINPDRGMVDTFEITNKIGSLLDIMSQGTDEDQEKVLDLLFTEKTPEHDAFYWPSPTEEFREKLKNRFLEHYGEKAVYCESAEEVVEATHNNLTGVQIHATFKQRMFQRAVPTLKQYKAGLGSTVDQRILWTDLPKEELEAVEKIREYLSYTQKASHTLYVTSFTDDDTLGMYDPSGPFIYIRRSLIQKPYEFMAVYLHELAHAYSNGAPDGSAIFIHGLHRTLTQTFRHIM